MNCIVAPSRQAGLPTYRAAGQLMQGAVSQQPVAARQFVTGFSFPWATIPFESRSEDSQPCESTVT